jgi:hypothetical protein
MHEPLQRAIKVGIASRVPLGQFSLFQMKTIFACMFTYKKVDLTSCKRRGKSISFADISLCTEIAALHNSIDF